MSQQDATATLLPLVADISVNPLRVAGLTRATCTTPVTSPSYTRCYTCETHRHDPIARPQGGRVWLADHVVPLQYAIRGQQSYMDARAYKNPQIPSDHNHSLIRMRVLASLFLLNHANCIGNAAPRSVDAMVIVPSLSRSTQMPQSLSVVARHLPPGWKRLSLLPGDDLLASANDRRRINPDHVRLHAPEAVRDRHVVVFDDTWTTGGHAQSVAVLLRRHGAAYVTVLVLNRDLTPEYGNNPVFIAKHLRDRRYDPALCPVTGSSCPPTRV